MPPHTPFSREPPAERKDVPMRCSEQYYIDDGNIVLFAEDVAFRVHKSQLARHSTTFQDMFAVATPLQSSETFGGLSVVRLSDKADEVLEFLQSLYGLPLYYKRNNVHQLASILRLSNKYFVNPLHEAVLDAMQRFYPDNLAQWRLAPARDEFWELIDDVSRARDIAVVIKSAYEANAEVLLPTAYYDLCGLRMDVVIKVDLPERMFVIYSRGKEDIISMMPDFIRRTIIPWPAACHGCKEPGCKRAWTVLKGTADQLMLQDSHWLRMPNPFEALSQISEFECMADVCRDCRKAFKEIIEQRCRGIWESLPGIFGLDSWKTLKGDRSDEES